jgi:RNA polymerase-binding transcription factor DksA
MIDKEVVKQKILAKISAMSLFKSDYVSSKVEESDEADQACNAENIFRLSALKNEDLKMYRKLKKALDMLGTEEFGECVSCGEDIPESRIMSVPWAIRCVECEEKRDRP